MSEVKGEIAPYNSLGWAKREAPLSGYLGGEQRGGKYVQVLEDAWASRFGVNHAIACNSATSGLMAAAFAVGLGENSHFAVSPFTMSATVAAPMFTGAKPDFYDVEDETFCLDLRKLEGLLVPDAIVITNLFGHPSYVMDIVPLLSEACSIIEDNSQAPFAMERGHYAGTLGNIGVFSLNVHKHLQCGEGGICVTNDASLGSALRAFINHGEMAGGPLGLNLRMPEISAAIALSQLKSANKLVDGRIAQAEAIVDAIGDIPGLRPPIVRDGCKHVYYAIPFLVERKRKELVEGLRAEGVPLSEGYVAPLYRLPAFAKFKRSCPVAEDLHDRQLLYFENCAWSPTKEQIKQIGGAFRKVAERIKL